MSLSLEKMSPPKKNGNVTQHWDMTLGMWKGNPPFQNTPIKNHNFWSIFWGKTEHINAKAEAFLRLEFHGPSRIAFGGCCFGCEKGGVSQWEVCKTGLVKSL